MLNRSSLKQRLVLLMLPAIVAVWAAAILMTHKSISQEVGELFDAHLAQTASILSAQSMHELGEIEGAKVPMLSHFSMAVAFQIWESEKDGELVLRLRSENAPQFMMTGRVRTGFSNVVIKGQEWRVFSSWDETFGTHLIHVAELVSEREDATDTVERHLIMPLLFSLPVLAFLLWSTVTHGLRPLGRLAHDVEQREPGNLAALDVSQVPGEVMPLVERLNRLFARIGASIQKERRFTADAAHELRTPVAAIKAQVQVAHAATDSDVRLRALDNAIHGCDRAARLIDQLLILARADALDGCAVEPCPLREIASRVIAESAPAGLAKNVHIELVEGDESVVRGDSGQLRILLRNLIENAIRHTPPDTTVRVGVVEQQGEVCLSVSDNGAGIAESERERVMERFYRVPGTQASGSGLGLSIVKRIAEMHGAALRMATPDDGKGLRVEVVFRT